MNYINIIALAKNLVYISLICTLLTLILSKSKFISGIRYVCGVSVLISVLTVSAPLINSLGELINIDFSFTENGGDGNDNTSDELIINQSALYICEYVKTLLNQKYDVPIENISAAVTLDSSERENVIIKNVTLSFKNTDESLYPVMARYVSDILGCECTVISR